MNLFESVRRHPVLWVFTASAVLLVGVAIAVLFLFFSPIRVDSISLDRSELSLYSLSQTHQLTATTQPADLPDRALVWTSSDPSVATVSSKGVVTAVGNGEALISVRGTQGDGIAHCTVRVTAISSISFATPEVVMGVGRSRMLKYTVEPEGIDVQSLVWSSSDPSVVLVYGTGVITSLKKGVSTITVSTPNGTVSQTCLVRVTENVPITGLSFAVTEFVFRSPEDELVLTPVFSPEDTSQRELEWISSSPDVATVNPETGEVTPLSNGETVIIAQSIHGDFSASCKVVVEMQIPVEGLSLETSSYTFKGLKQTYWIRPVFTPVNASNQKIIWTSSDPSVAKVSDQGLVTSLKKGTATITATTEEGEFTAEFKVTVSPNTNVPVFKIVLKSSAATLQPGQTCQISATVQPTNATNKTLTYTSQNTAVAKVSATGLVTAVGNGNTVISVASKDGKVVANFTVSVQTPVVEPDPPSEEEEEIVVTKEEVRGVWVATVANIDFPSKNTLTAAQLKAEIDGVMDNIVQMGLNTVYFQVRPCGDALYPSDLYPSSAYVVKKQGDPLPLDILEYAIRSAHERGLSFHAWINPYRVTSGTA
ncbi:MAG: Ig-like domain-containing protein, partial [Clostridia bacterium]|nr:Ig-like domain-containing protein [Clostridia bacterium]